MFQVSATFLSIVAISLIGKKPFCRRSTGTLEIARGRDQHGPEFAATTGLRRMPASCPERHVPVRRDDECKRRSETNRSGTESPAPAKNLPVPQQSRRSTELCEMHQPTSEVPVEDDGACQTRRISFRLRKHCSETRHELPVAVSFHKLFWLQRIYEILHSRSLYNVGAVEQAARLLH